MVSQYNWSGPISSQEKHGTSNSSSIVLIQLGSSIEGIETENFHSTNRFCIYSSR